MVLGQLKVVIRAITALMIMDDPLIIKMNVQKKDFR